MPKRTTTTPRKHSWLLKTLATVAFIMVIGNASGSAGSGYFSLTALFNLSDATFPLLWQATAGLFTAALFYGYYTVYGSAQTRVMSNLGHFIHDFLDAYDVIKQEHKESNASLGRWATLKLAWQRANLKYADFQARQKHRHEAQQLNLENDKITKYLEQREESYESQKAILTALKQDKAQVSTVHDEIDEQLPCFNKTYYETMGALFHKHWNNAYLTNQLLALQSFTRDLCAERATQEKSAYVEIQSDIDDYEEEYAIKKPVLKRLIGTDRRDPKEVFAILCKFRAIARQKLRQNWQHLLLEESEFSSFEELQQALGDLRCDPEREYKFSVIEASNINNAEYSRMSLKHYKQAWEAELALIKKEFAWEQAKRKQDQFNLSRSSNTQTDCANKQNEYKKARNQARCYEYQVEFSITQLALEATNNHKKQIRMMTLLRAERQNFDNKIYKGIWQKFFRVLSFPVAFFAALANGARGYFGVLAIAVALSSPGVLLAGVVIFGMLSSFNSSMSLTAFATVAAFEDFGRRIDLGEVTLGSIAKSLPKILLNTIACLGSAAFIFVATLKVLASAAAIGLVLSNPVMLGLAIGAAVFTFFAAYSLYAPHISCKPLHKIADFWRRVVCNNPHPDERAYTNKERQWRTLGMIFAMLAMVAAGLIAKVGFSSLIPMIAVHVVFMTTFPPTGMAMLIIGLAMVSAIVVGSLLAPAMYKTLGNMGRPKKTDTMVYDSTVDPDTDNRVEAEKPGHNNQFDHGNAVLENVDAYGPVTSMEDHKVIETHRYMNAKKPLAKDESAAPPTSKFIQYQGDPWRCYKPTTFGDSENIPHIVLMNKEDSSDDSDEGFVFAFPHP